MSRVRGFSLLEILVGMAIGLIITAGIIRLYATNKATYMVAEGIARQQENSRFAVTFMRQVIQRGGIPKRSELVPVKIPEDPQNPGDSGTSFDVDGDGTTGDSMVIRYRGGTDCLGNSPDSYAFPYIVENTLSVARSTGEGKGLECASAFFSLDGTELAVIPPAQRKQMVVSGIDHLQVLYGVDSDTPPDGIANRYYNSAGLQVADDSDPDVGLKVVSVRVALLVNTVEPVRVERARRTFYLLDAAPITFNDRLAREVVTITVPLRNRFYR